MTCINFNFTHEMSQTDEIALLTEFLGYSTLKKKTLQIFISTELEEIELRINIIYKYFNGFSFNCLIIYCNVTYPLISYIYVFVAVFVNQLATT